MSGGAGGGAGAAGSGVVGSYSALTLCRDVLVSALSGKLLLAPPASAPLELGLEPLELEPLLLGGLGGSCLDSLAGNLQRSDNAGFQPIQGNGPVPLLIALLVHVHKEAVLLVDGGGQLFPQEAALLLRDARQMVQAHGGVDLGVHLVHVLAA